MNHLYLAAIATQHAAKWQPSHAEVSDIRLVGAVALPICIIGLIRTVIKGRRQTQPYSVPARSEREYAD